MSYTARQTKVYAEIIKSHKSMLVRTIHITIDYTICLYLNTAWHKQGSQGMSNFVRDVNSNRRIA